MEEFSDSSFKVERKKRQKKQSVVRKLANNLKKQSEQHSDSCLNIGRKASVYGDYDVNLIRSETNLRDSINKKKNLEKFESEGNFNSAHRQEEIRNKTDKYKSQRNSKNLSFRSNLSQKSEYDNDGDDDEGDDDNDYIGDRAIGTLIDDDFNLMKLKSNLSQRRNDEDEEDDVADDVDDDLYENNYLRKLQYKSNENLRAEEAKNKNDKHSFNNNKHNNNNNNEHHYNNNNKKRVNFHSSTPDLVTSAQKQNRNTASKAVTASILHSLSIQESRKKGLLQGCANSNVTGDFELGRYFPRKRMTVYACTWNVCEMKTPPGDRIEELVLPEVSENLFDLYAFSTQETVFEKREWNVLLQSLLGVHFVLYHSCNNGTLLLSLFVRRDLIWYLSAPETSSVNTRAAFSNVKTKGAVALAFTLFGTSFLFINSHLRAHEGRCEDRIEDYRRIIAALKFQKNLKLSKYQGSDRDITSQADYTVWMGDLNSRMETERDKIMGAIDGARTAAETSGERSDDGGVEDEDGRKEMVRMRKDGVSEEIDKEFEKQYGRVLEFGEEEERGRSTKKNTYRDTDRDTRKHTDKDIKKHTEARRKGTQALVEKLLQLDELKRVMSEDLAFSDFSEGKIRFMPTYKFDIGTNDYDTSAKLRKPSYTDRILYRCSRKGDMKCLHYNSVPALLQSDHKPVYAVLEVRLKAGLDSVALSGGVFDREVWTEGLRRRADMLLAKNKLEKSLVCAMM